MKVRTTGLIALCAALAACNSRSSDETAVSTEADNQLVAVNDVMAVPAVMEPAPEGLPSRIAREVITGSGQACDSIATAERGQDGTITASCTSGQSYQVYTAPGQGPVATPL